MRVGLCACEQRWRTLVHSLFYLFPVFFFFLSSFLQVKVSLSLSLSWIWHWPLLAPPNPHGTPSLSSSRNPDRTQAYLTCNHWDPTVHVCFLWYIFLCVCFWVFLPSTSSLFFTHLRNAKGGKISKPRSQPLIEVEERGIMWATIPIFGDRSRVTPPCTTCDVYLVFFVEGKKELSNGVEEAENRKGTGFK